MTPSLRTLLRAFGDPANTKDPVPRAALKQLKKELVAADGWLVSGQVVEAVLEGANKLLQAHGVESIQDNRWRGNYWLGTGLVYVNMGDTYETTLFYDTERRRFYVGSWGDYIESSRELRRRFKEA